VLAAGLATDLEAIWEDEAELAAAARAEAVGLLDAALAALEAEEVAAEGVAVEVSTTTELWAEAALGFR
jgi:hypothetical protein